VSPVRTPGVAGTTVSGGGDPTFRCSSGHLTFDGLAPVATGFGGYQGSWIHGCP
jgi:hypothetical protein